MNVLILTWSFSFGGAEKQALVDANLLTENGIDTTLVYFIDGPLKSQVSSSVKMIYLPASEGYIKNINRIRSIIRNRNIDMVHTSLFAPMVMGAIGSIFTKSKVVWNFHSHEFDIPFRSKVAFYTLSKIFKVKKITYVNGELKEFFEQKLKMPKRKGIVLHNNSTFEKKIQFKKKDNLIFIIGYVGRVVELKRVEYFIDIAEYLMSKNITNFAIHIVGDGETRNSIENEVKNKDLNDYFVFHGFKTNLENYYEMFDIFINPSREECLSIALIDAGMKGIPSIAFDVGGNDEIIRNNESGFIVRSKEELNSQVYELLINKELQLLMSNNATTHCHKNFSKEKRLEELRKLFINL